MLPHALHKDELIVNMFISSVLEWKEYDMAFTQETSFPEKETTRMVLHTDKSKKMKVSFRCPEWIDKSKVAFAVNGKTVKATLTDGYYTIERKWQDVHLMKEHRIIL